MSYLDVEELINKLGSVYKLVNLAAKRALELNEGAPPLVKTDSKKKVTTVALEEILQGKVAYEVKKKRES